MRWIFILAMGFFLGMPLATSGAAVTVSTEASAQVQEVSPKVKKSKKKKRKRNWFKKNREWLYTFGFFAINAFLIIFGIIRKIRWMWILGTIGLASPILLGILFLLIYLIFGRRRRPIPIAPETEEQPKKKKPKTTSK